jgi:hypothetical protein
VTFQVLTAASVNMAVFWVVEPCSLIEFFLRLIGDCCLHHQGYRSDDVGTSETSVNFYQSTRRNNPEDSPLQQKYLFDPAIDIIVLWDKNTKKNNLKCRTIGDRSIIIHDGYQINEGIKINGH